MSNTETEDVLMIKFTSEQQARKFIAEGTDCGERVELDLEEEEVLGWFNDPGVAIFEVIFPVGASSNLRLVEERRAAMKVGAEFTVTRKEQTTE